MINLKNYVAEFEKKLKEIELDSKKVLIINAGSMNQGKSSLFNSLLDREVFKADDIRTTVKSQTEHWIEDIYLIDTPGLDAAGTAGKDDREAYNTYRRANMIIFVHTVRKGELHSAELDEINNIKAFFDDKKFFWEHFGLVLTFIESYSEGDIKSILQKLLGDIERHCGGKNFPVFLISNSRYKKGSTEGKKVLIEKSGVLQLRSYLHNNVKTWRNENNYFRCMKIDRAKKEITALLMAERENIQRTINQTTARIKKRQENFMYRLQSAVDEYRANDMEIDSMRYRLSSLRHDISSLKKSHKQDRARYDD